MNLKKEIEKLDFQIKDLESQKLSLEKEYIKERNERDKQAICENFDKLISLYKIDSENELFKKITVNCFPNRTVISAGTGHVTMGTVYLNSLLFFWSNGYTYNNRPIVNMTFGKTDKPLLTYMDENGKYKSEECNDEELVNMNNIAYETRNKFISSFYSKTSVADLFEKKKA